MGANGRHSSAVAERAFREGISRIRVIGREERTNAEQAQYRFLLFSLTTARDVPLFVNIVWFPDNTRAAECGEEIDLSCDHASRILVKLNHSQSKVVAAMVSWVPRDSLVIAHGILHSFFDSYPTILTALRLRRSSRDRKDDNNCCSRIDMGKS